MPNWVRNHLKIHGEKAAEVMRSYLIEDEYNDCGYAFDFNKILPMPEELNIISGTTTADCAKLFINAMLQDTDAFAKYAGLFAKAFERDFYLSESEQAKLMERTLEHKDHTNNELLFGTKADVYAYGKRALDNYEKYGAKDWYDWCIENWGTKWNACETQIDDLNTAEVYFDTAWSSISELVEKLAAQHPECRFEYEYAEEQVGLYSGYRNFENGILCDGEDYPTLSKEAYEMHFALWGMYEGFVFDEKEGTYKFVETEEEMS